MLKRLLAALLIFTAIDHALYFLLDRQFRSLRSGDLSGGHINWALETPSDVMVLGNSRARNNFVTPLLKSHWPEATVKNAGLMAQPLYYSLMMLELHKERFGHFPNTAIITLDPELLIKLDPCNRKLFIFNSFPSVYQDKLQACSWQHRAKLALVQSYSFNGRFAPMVKDLLTKHHIQDGYQPIYKVLGTTKIPNQKPLAIDEAKFNQGLKTLMAFLKRYQNDIKELIFINPPTLEGRRFFSPKHKQQLRQEFATTPGVRILFADEFVPELFRSQRLFGDPSHLNVKGSRLFTELFIAQLDSSSQPKAHH